MGKHEPISTDSDKSAARINRAHEEAQREPEHEEGPEAPVTDARALSDARASHTANTAQRAHILSGLQRTRGNAYVQRLLASHAIQAKLTVNPPDDQYEQEADRVGDAVVQAAGATAQRQEEEELQMKHADGVQRQEEEEEIMAKRVDGVQRQEEEELQMKHADGIQRQEEEELQMKLQRQEEEEEEEIMAKRVEGVQRQEEEELQMKLQRQPEEEEEPIQTKGSDAETPQVSDSLEGRINSARSGGSPLPESVRTSFEPHFGRDFTDVRVHADTQADSLSRSLEARAFTTGSDVFFRSGDYNPESDDGKRLLAHEMTHVVQQTGTAGRKPKQNKE